MFCEYGGLLKTWHLINAMLNKFVFQWMKAAYYIIRGEGGGGRDGVGDKHVDVNTKSASILF